MSTQFSALVSKLKEIFQINRPDLDFGVYRILNARSTEIAEFLDKRLKTKVEQYLGEAKSSLDENVLKELEAELKAEFGKRAFNEQGELIDQEAIESALGQKYIALTQADAHEMTDQSQVYSHLLTFFSRYYDDGDFISQRRYKGDTYAIPYSGEEVMLHWANKDQYYTKSGEMFSNYRFKLNDERSVLFRLVSADTARENRKDNDKDRRFIIVTEPKTFTRIDEDGEEFEETIVPFSIQNNELTILFEYATLPKGSKQETLNIESYNKIVSAEVLTTDWLNDLAQPAPTEKEPKRTVLHKHLSTYTQKNTADYFIHKDLGKFLRHELDFYIKNEVMHLDDVVSTDQFIQIERQLSIIKCLRQIGLEIISFLASLEDFQKKLWLKKKFVVSAEYCITLDRVDESLYTEIAENTAQWQQWEDLGFKGTDAGWGTVDYLKQHFPALEERIISKDFLKLKLEEYFPESFAIIGNFPYNISSQIFFKVLDYKNQVPEVVGMIQKEVAERLATGPGSKTYGILSVLLQAYYDIEYLFTVHENVFNPPPKVKSAVIRLTRNQRQNLDCDEKLFFTLVKSAFNQRRKTMRNSLKQFLTDETLKANELFNLRPEQLSVSDFENLTRLIQQQQS